MALAHLSRLTFHTFPKILHTKLLSFLQMHHALSLLQLSQSLPFLLPSPPIHSSDINLNGISSGKISLIPKAPYSCPKMALPRLNCKCWMCHGLPHSKGNSLKVGIISVLFPPVSFALGTTSGQSKCSVKYLLSK